MDLEIDGRALRETLATLPEMTGWPEIASFMEAQLGSVRPDWRLPAEACQAAGGDAEVALSAVAALACLQMSIILVDDVLDQDPRGAHHRLGDGRAANLALGLEAAALALVAQAPASTEARAQASAALARAALGTAYGQDLDVQNLAGEDNYWRVVQAKSTPFYGAALQVGALLGGASLSAGRGLYQVGALLGEIIQIFDDLVDAFAVPANPDWLEGRNNLALLYASTADHPYRARFRELLHLLRGHADDVLLHEGQQILIRCGAVSYCVYLLIQRYHLAQKTLGRVQVPHPDCLAQLLARQMQPLVDWLKAMDCPVPDELSSAGL